MKKKKHVNFYFLNISSPLSLPSIKQTRRHPLQQNVNYFRTVPEIKWVISDSQRKLETIWVSASQGERNAHGVRWITRAKQRLAWHPLCGKHKSLSQPGECWDFWFCGFGYLFYRFLGVLAFAFRFSPKYLRVLRFGIRCGFRFFPIWVRSEQQLCTSTDLE